MGEKKFDAVAMVRRIRDKHHEQFADKPVEERLAYYRKKAEEFEQKSGVTQRPNTPKAPRG